MSAVTPAQQYARASLERKSVDAGPSSSSEEAAPTETQTNGQAASSESHSDSQAKSASSPEPSRGAPAADDAEDEGKAREAESDSRGERNRGLSRRRGPTWKETMAKRWAVVENFAADNLNFYRIHVIVFTLFPLIISAIFYAANGEVKIRYIDCLVVCVSAMTVTGLTPINISTATPFQQFLLFFQMCIGGIGAVSIVMVLIRRHFFRKRFEDIVQRSAKARKLVADVEEAHKRERRREIAKIKGVFGLGKKKRRDGAHGTDSSEAGDTGSAGTTSRSSTSSERAAIKQQQKKKQAKGRKGPLTADMIRRMDQPAVLVNNMGVPSVAHPDAAAHTGEGQEAAEQRSTTHDTASTAGRGILNTQDGGDDVNAASAPGIRIALPGEVRRVITREPEQMESPTDAPPGPSGALVHRRGSASQLSRSADDGPRGAVYRMGDIAEGSTTPARRTSDPLRGSGTPRRGSDTANPRGLPPRASHDMFPRSQTVEFAGLPRGGGRQNTLGSGGGASGATTTALNAGQGLRQRHVGGAEFERTPTMMTTRSAYARRSQTGVPLTRTQTTAKERGFGGFPTPIELAASGMKRLLPSLQDRINRSTMMPRTATIASTHSGALDGGPGFPRTVTQTAPYLSFDVTVSRNSQFHALTELQRDELGGVEYRAIDMLAKLIPAYILGMVLIMFTIGAPWLASKSAVKANAVLDGQAPHSVDSTWFWLFQCVSAYTNTGLSLIDTSMINLADQYLMLIPMGLLIIMGNTGFPIFLRFFVWLISKCVPKSSRTYETLRFLLDHPRRCFIYLFPSAQTWFLLLVLIVLNSTDWVAFLVLDIGNTALEAIPLPQRVFDGLFQSIAVRAAGFQVVSFLTIAPAVQFLYVIMMYISAYPIAMSVRNTNVYEEKSLGVFGEEEEADVDEPTTSSARVWGNYLAAHARRQLAFDMWWLGFSLWLICIIERTNISDPTSNGWFTIFSCLFELTSAYGTVGLSLGTPFDNFSLMGRFSTLSKLVVVAVMLRGRHRGLPVAIDRAILLPGDMDELDYNDVVSLEPQDWDMLEGRTATSTFGLGDPTMSPQQLHPTELARSSSLGFGGGATIGSQGGATFYAGGLMPPVAEGVTPLEASRNGSFQLGGAGQGGEGKEAQPYDVSDVKEQQPTTASTTAVEDSPKDDAERKELEKEAKEYGTRYGSVPDEER